MHHEFVKKYIQIPLSFVTKFEKFTNHTEKRGMCVGERGRPARSISRLAEYTRTPVAIGTPVDSCRVPRGGARHSGRGARAPREMSSRFQSHHSYPTV